jgi:selenocysteine lyase/cysteine desulfurase
MWDQLVATQENARVAVGRLAGASADHVALMHSTHAGINTALWGMEFAAGDSILTTGSEHPGVLMPLRIARDRRGVEIRQVRFAPDPDELAANVAGAIDDKTRAVVLSHVSWTCGNVADLRKLRDAIGDDVRLIVDGAQGAGALPFDLADGWDAYTVSGQKWPGGPNGSGGLVLRDPEAWQPSWAGFNTVSDYMEPLDAPLSTRGMRLEHSQEALVPLVGVTAALDFLIDDVGVAEAAAHSASLNPYAREVLSPIVSAAFPRDDGWDGITGRAHLLCIKTPGHAERIACELIARRIIVRNVGADLLRVSLGWWNTPAELDQLGAALQELAPTHALT